jgi:phage-related protein
MRYGRREEMNKIVFYRKEDGEEPVSEFLKGLPKKHQAKALHDITLLKEFGAKLTMPYVRHIDGKLWELRVQSSGDISRIFYFAHNGTQFVLLHGFIKKTPKTPKREIDKAQLYLTDFLRRTQI